MKIDDIDIEVFYKKIKNFRITITNEGIKAYAPLFMGKKEIRDIVLKKMHLIKKHIAIVEQRKKYETKEIENGNKVYLWGKEYHLVVENNKKNTYFYDENNIYLFVKNEEEKQKVLDKLYRDEIKNKALVYMLKWSEKTKLIPNEWHIKKMKTRWGSCNIKARRIWLNLNLAKYDERCLEYVVLHEIAHLYEKNHDKRFYHFINSYMPNWREVKGLLQ